MHNIKKSVPIQDGFASGEHHHPNDSSVFEHGTTHDAALRGHCTNDKYGISDRHQQQSVLTRPRYGNALVNFDRKAEAKLRLKIDLMIVPTVSLLYLFCFIDRANVGNARLAGLEKDLNLSGYDYNTVLSVFYISYIIFEVRSYE